jgi:hypothetical protein
MKTSTPLLAAALLCGLCGSAMAAVTASLDRDQVADGETVQLTLQHDGQGGGQPDLGPLKKDFDVLGTSTSSNLTLVNGHFSSQREVQLTLAPRHGGTLQIPPLSWDGEQSQPLSLTVSGGGSAAAGNSSQDNGGGSQSAPVFLTSSLDQSQPYVQGTAVLTVQVHASQPLYQASLDLSGNADVAVQQLGKDQHSSETRNGRHYDVIKRKYLLQPQRSGKLSLDGPELDAQVMVSDNNVPSPFGPNSPFGRAFGNAFSTARPLRLHGDTIELDVRPRPATATGRDWLPAKQISVEQSWKPDSDSVHAGDPLTLHLRLRATGLTGAQLPDLSSELALPDGLKAYPDQAKLDTQLQNGEVVGTREQDIALIADRPGHYEVPALHLPWWDTQKDQPREVVLPERTLDVLPAAGAPATPPPAAVQTPPATATAPAGANQAPPSPTPATLSVVLAHPIWFWVSVVLGLLWIGTVIAWWRKRPTAPSPRVAPEVAANPSVVVEAGEARRAFQQACRSNDPQAARRSLLQWARAVWPAQPPAGLEALAQHLDAAAGALLRQLDRACYAGGQWNGGELAQKLKTLEPEREPQKPARALPELYR